MAQRRKFYVVWNGVAPGIYDSWAECQAQINGYPNAQYKSFDSKEDAIEAYRGSVSQYMGIFKAMAKRKMENPEEDMLQLFETEAHNRPTTGIAVDGACSGVPGRMEYRGVRIDDGVELFHIGVKNELWGTNNIAEFCAIIHCAALLANAGDTQTTIYSDSRTALAWLRKGHSASTLERSDKTAATYAILDRADLWLRNNRILNPVLKWDTEKWGEIPADFGRK